MHSSRTGRWVAGLVGGAVVVSVALALPFVLFAQFAGVRGVPMALGAVSIVAGLWCLVANLRQGRPTRTSSDSS